MTDRLNQFVFKGVLASHAAAELRATGLLRTPMAAPDERAEQDLFAPVGEVVRNASRHMQHAYRVLFAFENSARDFISSRLTEADGETWFDKRANADMKRKVEQRKAQEEKNQWHPGRNAHPIYYIDFGDLGLLIINHWELFRDFFPNQPWVTSRFQEAERTRNVIAHTNVLPHEETARLEMYLRDWLAQTGG